MGDRWPRRGQGWINMSIATPMAKMVAALILVLAAGLFVREARAAQETRVALVLANANYQTTRDLPNALRDATLIGRTMRSVGFTVTTGVDLTQAGMQKALRDFSIAAAKADVALIYYAGHGIEVDGMNYLVPVDASLGSPNEVEFEAIPLDLAMRSVQRARRLKIVLLDSCRDNPFMSKWNVPGAEATTRSVGGRGLAPIHEPPGETLVSYAARAGSRAADGKANENSPYARAVARRISESGAEISLVFRRIRDDVLAETANQQEPFTYGSLSGSEFYFVPKGARLTAGPDPAKGKKPGETFRDCPDCPEMMIVPPGRFMMGSDPQDEGATGEESPKRAVTIDRAFAVGEYEVTFAEWDACVRAGGCSGYRPDDAGGGRGSFPVVNVGWTDAQEYIKWLNIRTGRTYRLLSEAEWEYAARAGTTTPYPWGDKPSHDFANHGNEKDFRGLVLGRDKWKDSAPVGSFPANPFGLHDMHGNVWEWTDDCWNESYVGAGGDRRSRTSGDCSRRALRGGSFNFPRRYSRSVARFGDSAAHRYLIYGFRVARDL